MPFAGLLIDILFYAFLIIVAIKLIRAILLWYPIQTADTVIAFTGGLGSGKSLLSVKCALKCLKQARIDRFIQMVFHPIRWRNNAYPRPELYSSIPVRISKYEMSNELTPDIILLQKRIPPHSIVFIDELGSFCNQFEYQCVNAGLLDEFIRLFRHYTHGGKLIVNDQCSENIVLQVRRRLNTIYNLQRFRRSLILPISFTHVRNISISEEIKTIQNETNSEDQTRLCPIWLPRHRKPMYDTYCYSRRYQMLAAATAKRYTELKKDFLLKIPKERLFDTIEIERLKRLAVAKQCGSAE